MGYGANFIKKYYADHRFSGIEIVFSSESKPLGTGGAVKKARRFIKSKDFMVINGDSFSDFSINRFVDFYRQKKARALILLRKMKNKKDYGLVITNASSEITSFNEKIRRKHNGFINSGVYLFNRRVFSMMPNKSTFSLEHDFFPEIVGKGLYGYKGTGFFIDIGTPERYLTAKKYFFKRKGY